MDSGDALSYLTLACPLSKICDKTRRKPPCCALAQPVVVAFACTAGLMREVVPLRVSGEWRGGISPPRPRRTVRERLRSYGSHCGATPHAHLPVGKQPWITPRNPCDPVRRSAHLTTQLLVLPIGPAGQRAVQLPHNRVQCRAIIPPVILEPAPDLRVEHP